MKIDFTEEMVMNPDAMPEGIKDLRYYRQEFFIEGHMFPVEMGGIWLPPDVDIEDVMRVCNKGVDLYTKVW